MFFYKVYKYSNKATLISLLFRLLALIFAVVAIGGGTAIDSVVLKVIIIIVCVAGAVFSWMYLSGTLSDKIAEKDFAVKIKKSANVALLYCKDHPEEFDAIAAENPAFAAKYRMDENGKIVKNK